MSILNNRKKHLLSIDNLKTSKKISEIYRGCEISYSELEEKASYIKSIENEVKNIKKHLDNIDKIENEIQNLKLQLYRMELKQKKENSEFENIEISLSNTENKASYIKSIENAVTKIKRHLNKSNKTEKEIQNLKLQLYRMEEKQKLQNEEVKREVKNFNHDPSFLLEVLLMD